MSKPLLLTASFCQPCQQVKKYIQENGMDVEIVDVTEQPEVASEYGIRSVPVLIVDNGLNRFTSSGSIIKYLGGVNES